MSERLKVDKVYFKLDATHDSELLNFSSLSRVEPFYNENLKDYVYQTVGKKVYSSSPMQLALFVAGSATDKGYILDVDPKLNKDFTEKFFRYLDNLRAHKYGPKYRLTPNKI